MQGMVTVKIDPDRYWEILQFFLWFPYTCLLSGLFFCVQERGMFVQRLVRLDRLSEVHVQAVVQLQLEVRDASILV